MDTQMVYGHSVNHRDDHPVDRRDDHPVDRRDDHPVDHRDDHPVDRRDDHMVGHHDNHSMNKLLSTWFVHMYMGICTDMVALLGSNMSVDKLSVDKIHRHKYRHSCSSHCNSTEGCASQEHPRRTISCTNQDSKHILHI
jgi:hypothetical protein